MVRAQQRGVVETRVAAVRPMDDVMTVDEARALASRIGRVTFEHVRRERNREADRLANLAMDGAAGRTLTPGE